jgi:dihydrofolate reductase
MRGRRAKLGVVSGDGLVLADRAAASWAPGKPISAIGGAGFMRSLIATGLIDECHLVTHPVVLGEGLTIFDGAPHSI